MTEPIALLTLGKAHEVMKARLPLERKSRINSKTLCSLLSISLWLCAAAFPGRAQEERRYDVRTPRTRTANENVTAKKSATQASKGILIVLVNPVIASKVVVTDSKGKELDQAETDNEDGQADFELRRGQSYIVKASSPGYLNAEAKVSLVSASKPLRLTLTPQYARLILPNLPLGAQVFLDDQLRATATQSAEVTINEISAGDHKLLIRHSEYNDYADTLSGLKAGNEYTYGRIPLTRMAKLTVRAIPGATVWIDGDKRGKVNADGQVRIDYELTEAAEHTIAIELLGYQTWTSKELLKPGPREIAVKLDPIITSKGTSDIFDNLSLWDAPSDWTIARVKVEQGITTRLQVSGKTIGLLKDKTYRDFEAVFTVWLNDGKGATWAVRVDKNNYYLFHLTGPKSGELAPRKLYTYRVKDGQVTEVNTPTPVLFEIKEKESYTIFVTVSGHTISHKLANLNGEESPAIFTDTSNDKDLFLYGRFGFLSFKGEVFQVDDFDIQPKNEQ